MDGIRANEQIVACGDWQAFQTGEYRRNSKCLRHIHLAKCEDTETDGLYIYAKPSSLPPRHDTTTSHLHTHPPLHSRPDRLSNIQRRLPIFFLPPVLDLGTSGSGSSQQWLQSLSIFTVAQISPRPQGFWIRADCGQKAAKTVLV